MPRKRQDIHHENGALETIFNANRKSLCVILIFWLSLNVILQPNQLKENANAAAR